MKGGGSCFLCGEVGVGLGGHAMSFVANEMFVRKHSVDHAGLAYRDRGGLGRVDRVACTGLAWP